MFIKLLLCFAIVPMIELYVLIRVGGMIGLIPTLVLILATGIAGAYLARLQGLDLWRRIQNELGAGRMPATELLDGFLVLVGALLLLTPGFCTDLCGFCLLVPATRRRLKGPLQAWLQRQMASGRVTILHRN